MTSRDELVEQVARAIIRRRAETGDDLGPGLTGDVLNRYVDGAWQYWRDDARAAILATLKGVRDATPEMINAGGKVLNQFVGKDPADWLHGTADWADEVWRAMVDRRIKDFEA